MLNIITYMNVFSMSFLVNLGLLAFPVFLAHASCCDPMAVVLV